MYALQFPEQIILGVEGQWHRFLFIVSASVALFDLNPNVIISWLLINQHLHSDILDFMNSQSSQSLQGWPLNMRNHAYHMLREHVWYINISLW